MSDAEQQVRNLLRDYINANDKDMGWLAHELDISRRHARRILNGHASLSTGMELRINAFFRRHSES